MMSAARMTSGRIPRMNARRLFMDGPRGGYALTAVIESTELADHVGDGRRARVPGSFPETPIHVGVGRVEGSIDDRSRLDVLDLDVRAPEGRGECVEHCRLGHGAGGHDVLEVRQREIARDDALAEPGEV